MFNPAFSITPKTANSLLKIESIRHCINDLPITPTVLKTLRETARLYSTHYSTMIEGNRLSQEEVNQVITHHGHFPGCETDEKEVLGYYAALEEVEKLTACKVVLTEKHIQTIHASVLVGGKKKVTPTSYRDGQNVIRDAGTRQIVYLPPEAKDVPLLMKELVLWLNSAKGAELPCAIRAGIAHYQFATIHPYYDGNGRTARLLTTLILHLGGYDLKGIYSLEEYYARDLNNYYEALNVGPSHNYYLGRKDSDITKWVEYFCSGMADSFEKVELQAIKMHKRGSQDSSKALKELDSKMRKVLSLFQKSELIYSKDVETLFNIKPRTARALCQKWVEEDVLIIEDVSKKGRKYSLSPKLKPKNGNYKVFKNTKILICNCL